MDMYVGTYTGKSDSCGIYRVRLLDDGRLSTPELIVETRDPSYIALSADGNSLFAVDEQQGQGGLVSFTKCAGKWLECGRASSGGGWPCHVALSPDESEIAVANFEDGAVAIGELSGGRLTGKVQSLPGRTDAPGTERQECSHAHMCAFWFGRLLVCDLGCDMVRAFDKADGVWREGEPFLRLSQGTGPRHMARGRCGAIYVLGELDSRLHVFLPEGDSYRHAAALPATVPDAHADAAAVRVSKDGAHVLCSTRKDGRISIFDVDEHGMPHMTSSFDCGGSIPRDADFTGEYIVCACQSAGGLILLKPDGKGGAQVVDRAMLGAPVCILNLDKE